MQCGCQASDLYGFVQWKAKAFVAVTHLAIARSQTIRGGILGYFLVIKLLLYEYDSVSESIGGFFVQKYNIKINPRKPYKRVRMKWLLFFLIIGAAIVWLGTKDVQETQPQPEAVQPLEEPRDDYVYLEESPDIRVILQAGNYGGIYHAKVELAFPNGGYILTCVNEQWEKHTIPLNDTVSIGIGAEFDFSITKDMLIAAVASEEDKPIIVNSLERNREVCRYYGRMEITLEDAGLLVVNALPLENYLCGVVPSEMPASYEEEALKAQAILARTYAYKYLIEPAYPQFQAHVDDSIAFQVYGNLDNNAVTSKAVSDTAGILLFSDRSLAEVYYYSTSCGYGTDGTAWGGEGQEYLQATRIGKGALKSADGSMSGEEAEEYYLQKLEEEQTFRNMITAPFVDGYESCEGWYRWSACDVPINAEALLARMKERYEANPNVILTKNKAGEFVSKPVKSLGDIKNIKVEERGAGGVCKSVIIEGNGNTYKVLLEYNIRYVLNGSGTSVIKADDTETYCKTLLPSGFFYLDTVHFGQNVISYNIYGGGYGHGVGLSQNGANQMAKLGMNCQEILFKFFPGTVFVSYENHS